jgi:formylglycine-generating enzyme required for sulfatase activity
VAEWTASKWQAADKNDSQVVARGGSWQDIPYRARPGSRAPYRPEMKVVDVGFRVIISPDPGPVVRSSPQDPARIVTSY